VVGVDLSESALDRARRKARGLGKPELRIMDARSLDFGDGVFDRVLCVHVLDFVDPVERVIGEVMRVLRSGGRFVVTLPSDKEDAAMGGALFGDQVRGSLRAGKTPLRLVAEMLILVPVGLLYLPLLFRPRRKAFTREQAAALFDGRGLRALAMEEEHTYQDLILAGSKA
jgi:SAM-dependent methyltransferase